MAEIHFEKDVKAFRARRRSLEGKGGSTTNAVIE
jgi:hypothetical protein